MNYIIMPPKGSSTLIGTLRGAGGGRGVGGLNAYNKDLISLIKEV